MSAHCAFKGYFRIPAHCASKACWMTPSFEAMFFFLFSYLSPLCFQSLVSVNDSLLSGNVFFLIFPSQPIVLSNPVIIQWLPSLRQCAKCFSHFPIPTHCAFKACNQSMTLSIFSVSHCIETHSSVHNLHHKTGQRLRRQIGAGQGQGQGHCVRPMTSSWARPRAWRWGLIWRQPRVKARSTGRMLYRIGGLKLDEWDYMDNSIGSNSISVTTLVMTATTFEKWQQQQFNCDQNNNWKLAATAW